ncbi:MAG: nucleocapsid protein [Hangzhou rhabdovirus 4]|uniref:Nucleoprotein n=1 Tax=Hangzhou rhabdovirus 4 TaxID=2905393 RepID=A0A8K1XB58_9RHAB|nr:MAG: nucleocapsid protein [Hangzhou rhabdovirus 4]
MNNSLTSSGRSVQHSGVFSKHTNEPIPSLRVTEGKSTVYPSTVLKMKKPSLTVDKIKEDFDIISMVRGALHQTIPPAMINRFLYDYLKDYKETLVQSWSSYDHPIGKTGDLISPWNVVTVVESQKMLDVGEMRSNEDEKITPLQMATLFCGVYRISYSNSKQTSSLSSTLSGLIGNVTINVDSFVLNNANLSKDVNFRKIMAAIDMFLYMFPESELGQLRWGTIPSRYRNCAGIRALHTFPSWLGLEVIEESMTWIFYACPGRQAGVMIKDLDDVGEMSNDYSYFPYHVDLAATIKTPYSASVNKELMFLIQAVGCLLGKSRSMNARKLDENGTAQLLANAIIIAYAHDHDKGASLQYATKESFMEEKKTNEELDNISYEISADEAANTFPTVMDPHLWSRSLNTMYNPTDKKNPLNAYLKAKRSFFENPRPDTVGKYIANFINSLP